MPSKTESPVPESPKTMKAQKIQFDEGKQQPKIIVPDRPPTDPIEHFRRFTCEKGHMDWDPKNIKYSIDHRSHIIFCMSCEEYYVIPAGSPKPLSLPEGAVPVS